MQALSCPNSNPICYAGGLSYANRCECMLQTFPPERDAESDILRAALDSQAGVAIQRIDMEREEFQCCRFCKKWRKHYCDSYFIAGGELVPLFGFCNWTRRYYYETCDRFESDKLSEKL